MRELSVRLPARPDAVSVARHSVRSLRPRVGPDAAEEVALLVSELVTNSIRHAELRPDETIELDISLDGGRVRVEVTDPGGGRPRLRDTAPEEQCGYGLQLVDLLASRWGVRRSGQTCVWFELDLPGKRSP